MSETRTVAVGVVLYGYCGGYFGDHAQAYDDKRVEALGADWVIARSIESPYAIPLYADVIPHSLEEFTIPIPDPYEEDES